jgi:hypothetical protein
MISEDHVQWCILVVVVLKLHVWSQSVLFGGKKRALYLGKYGIFVHFSRGAVFLDVLVYISLL